VGSAALRERGYREALDAAGIPFDPALVGEAGFWHRSTGADAMRALLDSGVEVDAVFAMNDAMALGVLHVLHDRRVRVPGEVAVIGFDDIDDGAYSAPTLSTISPGREQIARTAVDLLRRRIADSSARPYEQVVADYAVVVRESTADVAVEVGATR
jgi:DNA-binding LacI/PurR family transcriptional regulator